MEDHRIQTGGNSITLIMTDKEKFLSGCWFSYTTSISKFRFSNGVIRKIIHAELETHFCNAEILDEDSFRYTTFVFDLYADRTMKFSELTFIE